MAPFPARGQSPGPRGGVGFAPAPGGADLDVAQSARQAGRPASVDVSEHTREGIPPNFLQLTSQAASSAQCDDPKYLAWFRLLTGVTESELSPYNRKTWDWAYLAEAATRAGLM